MLSATENLKLQQHWSESDTQIQVATQSGQPVSACTHRLLAALCHEVRALTIVVLAGQR